MNVNLGLSIGKNGTENKSENREYWTQTSETHLSSICLLWTLYISSINPSALDSYGLAYLYP